MCVCIVAMVAKLAQLSSMFGLVRPTSCKHFSHVASSVPTYSLSPPL